MTVTVPDLAHLKRAYAVTSPATQITPLLESAALGRATGAARVFVKPESLQWAGSFKVRGAYWRLKQLSTEEAKRGVVSYSSGNFAQGLAAAGEALGIPVTIVMPIDAPAAKRDATAGYGARVVLSDHGARAREEVASERARQIAADEGFALLHPFDDVEIVAGQA
ncbi:pyridoxal-phosphate dependent enzyme, partial [Rhizobiaceae sp. 2RAB30]